MQGPLALRLSVHPRVKPQTVLTPLVKAGHRRGQGYLPTWGTAGKLQQSLGELTEDAVSLPHAVCFPPFARRLPQLPSEPSLARALGRGGLYLQGLLLLSLEQRKPVLHLLELPLPSKLWLRVPTDVPYHSSSRPSLTAVPLLPPSSQPGPGPGFDPHHLSKGSRLTQ